MNNTKVSICVPIYGVEKYISRCAISLFEQTYDNIEFIFVNDCTKDKSIDILLSVLENYPNRKHQTKIINHEFNKGLGASRNTAVSCSTGEFVIHVDSDDYVSIDAVEILMKTQSISGADIVFSNACKIHKHYKEWLKNPPIYNPLEYSKQLLTHKVLGCIWGRLIRRSLYTEHEIKVEEGTNMGEDIQVIPLLTYYAQKIGFTREILYYYDCTFEASYSNMYSKEKLHQDWRSLDIARAFFIEKGYKEVAIEAELKNIATHLVLYSHIPNISYYYEESKSRLKDIEKKYWKLQPLQMRLLFYLCDYPKMLKIYARFGSFMKRMIKYVNK